MELDFDHVWCCVCKRPVDKYTTHVDLLDFSTVTVNAQCHGEKCELSIDPYKFKRPPHRNFRENPPHNIEVFQATVHRRRHKKTIKSARSYQKHNWKLEKET